MCGVKPVVTLKKTLGFRQTFGVAVGLVVASTTMVSLGNAFGIIGGVFIVPSVVAMLLFMCVALSYAELSSAIPGAGMIGDYTLVAMGRSMSIFSVLVCYIITVAFTGAVEGILAGISMNSMIPSVDARVFASIWVVALCLVNLFGVEVFGRVQLFLTISMMGTIGLMGILGLAGIGTVVPKLPEIAFNPNGIGTAMQGLTIAIWLFIGIEYVCPMAEEIEKPEKNIPKAMLFGLLTIFVVKMLFGLSIIQYVSPEMLANSEVPQIIAATTMFGDVGLYWLGIATVLAAASTIDSHFAALPRMLYGLARHGALPKIFTYLHPRFRTPWVGISLVFILLYVPMMFNKDIEGIMTMVLVACVVWLTSYIIAQIDLIILRKKYPNLKRPFKCPLVPIPQILGIAICIFAIVVIHPDPEMKKNIMSLVLIVVACTTAYSVLWVKIKQKKECFKPVRIEDTELEHELEE